ncbi:hypothetical protein PM082_017722 [Marasmius tenuissimus]|nr:hypothetical protein PM082_017722 [Marasmius tenuissimus]
MEEDTENSVAERYRSGQWGQGVEVISANKYPEQRYSQMSKNMNERSSPGGLDSVSWYNGKRRTKEGAEIFGLCKPIFHIHLRKLATRADYRVATLSSTHPTRSLLRGAQVKDATPHPKSLANLTEAVRKKVKGTVMEIDKVSTKLTEEFDPTHEDANPGNRLRDRYPDRITFTEQAKDKEKSESESLAEWVTFLDRKLEILEDDPDTVVAATDASVPQNPRHQAASAAMIYRSGDLIHQTRYASGVVTAPDAELYAIRVAISYMAMSCGESNHFVLFTDCIAAAKRAIDPSIHSGQSHSLAVCRALSDWFAGGDDRKVTFIQVPSKAKWSIHQLAHESVRGLPPIGVGAVPQTSLDRLRQEATKAGQDAWVSRFQDPSYRGRHFYELQDLKDRPLQPSYLKGGTWLKLAGGSLSLTTRMTRCILGHAPIGEYYQRFNIQADLSCLCGVEPGTRAHVLYRCSELERGASLNRLPGLIAYLKANPRAFAFPSQAEAEGVG